MQYIRVFFIMVSKRKFEVFFRLIGQKVTEVKWLPLSHTLSYGCQSLITCVDCKAFSESPWSTINTLLFI